MKHLITTIILSQIGLFCTAQNWNRTGNQIFNLNSGNVGVGLNNPYGKLHIESAIWELPWLDESGAQHCGTSSLVIEGLRVPNGGCEQTEAGEFDNQVRKSYLIEGIIDDAGFKTRRFTVDALGRVGIGNNLEPTQDLDVEGNIRMRTGASPGYLLVSDFDGTMRWTDPKSALNGGYWGQNQDLLFTNDTTSKISIGTRQSVTGFRMNVNGGILCTELKVMEYSGWDRVFQEDYELLSLNEVRSFIAEHKHLPHLKAAETYEAEGIDLSEMNGLLLRKVEELTLYLLELQEEIEAIKANQ